MADLTFHNVTKIEVLKRIDHNGFSVRNIVIHNDEWNSELGERIATQTEVSLFLKDKASAKPVYNHNKTRR